MERKLFSTARVIVLISMACLLLAFSLEAVNYVGNVMYPNTHVAPSYVSAVVKRGGASTGKASPEFSTALTLSQVSLPPMVSEEFKTSDRDTLAGWIDALEPGQRQDFLDNMEQAIAYARNNRENVTDSINSYKTLKFEKLKLEKEKAPNNLIIVSLLIGALITFVLLTLILVMLAVERNTRVQVSP